MEKLILLTMIAIGAHSLCDNGDRIADYQSGQVYRPQSYDCDLREQSDSLKKLLSYQGELLNFNLEKFHSNNERNTITLVKALQPLHFASRMHVINIVFHAAISSFAITMCFVNNDTGSQYMLGRFYERNHSFFILLAFFILKGLATLIYYSLNDMELKEDDYNYLFKFNSFYEPNVYYKFELATQCGSESCLPLIFKYIINAFVASCIIMNIFPSSFIQFNVIVQLFAFGSGFDITRADRSEEAFEFVEETQLPSCPSRKTFRLPNNNQNKSK